MLDFRNAIYNSQKHLFVIPLQFFQLIQDLHRFSWKDSFYLNVNVLCCNRPLDGGLQTQILPRLDLFQDGGVWRLGKYLYFIQ